MISTCWQCGKSFTKKHPSQKFCRSHGPGNCKDRYHNLADPARLARVGIEVEENWDPGDDMYYMNKDPEWFGK